MNYAPSQYPSPQPYTPPRGDGGAPPRRRGWLVGGIVIGCTALLLGSILLLTFMANRPSDSDGPGIANEGSGSDAGDTGGGSSDGDASGDAAAESVAIAVVEIMYGLSSESSEGYLCSDPGPNLANIEVTGETMAELWGDTVEMVDEIVATDSYQQGEAVEVEVAMVIYGTETPMGTVEVVEENGGWKACDFDY